ncbi:MAG: hypothetical protein LBV04_09815, partial [Deferribacteraceae bacterium]|nr:hypothetical protein [Deferribacteraceae bacterium]
KIFGYEGFGQGSLNEVNVDVLRAHSQHVLAAMVGAGILNGCAIPLDKLDHATFAQAHKYFDGNKELLCKRAEEILAEHLARHLASLYPDKPIFQIDGRTLTSVLRRPEVVDLVISKMIESK